MNTSWIEEFKSLNNISSDIVCTPNDHADFLLYALQCTLNRLILLEGNMTKSHGTAQNKAFNAIGICCKYENFKG
jgi:hypothetical protein